jgi:hypothetical protein
MQIFEVWNDFSLKLLEFPLFLVFVSVFYESLRNS